MRSRVKKFSRLFAKRVDSPLTTLLLLAYIYTHTDEREREKKNKMEQIATKHSKNYE